MSGGSCATPGCLVSGKSRQAERSQTEYASTMRAGRACQAATWRLLRAPAPTAPAASSRFVMSAMAHMSASWI